MENIQFPYSDSEINTPIVRQNVRFLESLGDSVKDHSVFDHAFLRDLGKGMYSKEDLVFVLAQIAKMVKPFTGALSALIGRAPDIKSRFVLFDNLYEEMGRGLLHQSHPVLYLKMLDSMGMSEDEVEQLPTITAIRLLNDALFDAILRKPFHVGCAWLGYGGELTIPNNFPYLMDAIKRTFKPGEINTEFWDRHGDRDQGHSDDATLLLALHISPENYQEIETEVRNSLTLRKLVWDELQERCATKIIKPVEKYANNMATGYAELI